jgi:hypothetical protein
MATAEPPMDDNHAPRRGPPARPSAVRLGTSRRRCLGCERDFTSKSAGNRLCDRCNGRNLQMSRRASGPGSRSLFSRGEASAVEPTAITDN